MVKIMKDCGMDSHRLATIMGKTIMALPSGGQNTEKTGKNGGRIATYMCKFVQPKKTTFWKRGKHTLRKKHEEENAWKWIVYSGLGNKLAYDSNVWCHSAHQSIKRLKEYCFQKKPTFHVCEQLLSWECSL